MASARSAEPAVLDPVSLDAGPTRPGRRRPWRLTEPPPPTGVALPAAPGIRRVVAPNPGPMTYHGTNTWLVDWAGGTLVIDPGCDDPAHLDAVLAEAKGRVSHILLTHTHQDHLGGAEALARRSGAPVAGHHRSAHPQFQAPLGLGEGDRIGSLVVLDTPGHAMDHLCFATDDGILFTGDHVMGWSTSVVPPPPAGDLSLFVANLRRVRDRGDRLMLSAHGPAIERPHALVQSLLDHRAAREASIASVLTRAPLLFEAVFGRAYRNLRPDLHAPARANLLSHLIKLEADGRAMRDAQGWRCVG